MRFIVFALAIAACKPVAIDDSDDGIIDATSTWEASREGAIAFEPPEQIIEPYTDVTECWFATYDGPEIGIDYAEFHQNPEYGHHVILMTSEADEDAWPDGTLADCTETNADIMVDSRPFLFANAGIVIGSSELLLPEGMAVKLKAGTRFLVQSHHINPGPDPVRVNDAIFINGVDPTTVDTWTAPWVNTQTQLDIPPGESEITVDCAFESDVHVTNLLGHLHEWGASYAVDHVRADGTSERLYDIPEWDVQFRDTPPVNTYAEGEFQVLAGERFVTTCAWNNDTGANLGFPEEMCATVGFAYPLVVPWICEPDL